MSFSINGEAMGRVLSPTPARDISVSVEGGDTIDYIELLHNNSVINRWNPDLRESVDPLDENLKIYLELGWGERGQDVDWQAELRIADGELLSVEPRFRGHEVVEPQHKEMNSYAFSAWEVSDSGSVQLSTRTWGNPTTSTASTQGMCFEIRANPTTRLTGHINGQTVDVPLDRLLDGPYSEYLGGFLSPAYCIHQAVPQSAYSANFELSHYAERAEQSWYYLRVRQKNGQWAWSSPIWVQSVAN